MDLFFKRRVNGYDEHMKNNIEGAREFYAYTASLLPMEEGARILDLGCGTGLELEEYFKLNKTAAVTGIDLSAAMLDALKKKLKDENVTLIRGSYFDEPFGESVFDGAVSVESLHHFTAAKKETLYRKLRAALKKDGYFVLTDYFAASDEEEMERFEEFEKIKKEQGLSAGEFYHYDVPLTVKHEISVLRNAGFSDVKIMKNFGNTSVLIAKR